MVRLDSSSVNALVKSQPQYAGCKGSVVRVAVSDFMTYHSMEFFAGAHVNLILGPNGTGKSTIVCAICLGLAGKPKILGRALVLKEYIRHGAKSATIEIELFNPDGMNHIIKRRIKQASGSGGTSTQWYYQKKPTNQSTVEELTSSLNIQLDNLCQFLPQDRVQDFVVMDAFSLLQNTQKASGDEKLYSRHENLIKITATLQEIERNLKTHADSLKAAQQYTKRLEKDVVNFREREALKIKIANFASTKSWIVYCKSREAFCKLKAQLESVKLSKAQEEAKLAPSRKSLVTLESKSAKLAKELNELRTTNNVVMNAAKKKVEEEYDRVETLVSNEQASVTEHERSEKERLERVGNSHIRGKTYEKQLEECRLKGDMDDAKFNDEIGKLENQSRAVDNSILVIKVDDEKAESGRRYLIPKIRHAQNELSKMDDLRESRMRYLYREQRDVHDTVMFYSNPENRARFKGRMHEPMILHIHVNDLKYGRIAEKHIGFSDLTSFLCEEKDDIELMLEINKQRGKRVSVQYHKGPTAEYPFQKPACQYQPDFMAKWGFQLVLFDIIEGPEYYLSYLEAKHRFGKYLIGSEETGKRFEEIREKTTIDLFYTEKSSYRIQRSYYSNSKLGFYNPLPAARVMTTDINAVDKQKLEEDVLLWKKEEEKLKAEIDSRAGRKAELEDKRQTLDDNIKDINARIEYRNKTQHKLDMVKKQLIGLEREKKDLDSIKRASEKAVLNHRMKLITTVEFVAKEIKKLSANGIKPIVMRRQISLIQSRLISRKNELELMQGAVKECEAQIKLLTPKVEQSAKEAEANKKEAISKSNNVLEPPEEVVNGEVNEIKLDKELNLVKVQLSFLMDTDPSIIQDYQEKMREIEDLERNKEHGEQRLANLKTEIEKEKEAWLNPLQDLIRTVNRNFGRFFASMGCAGEVVLHKGDNENDFAKYGIKILVKFRSSEPLSELGGSKGGSLQSGGERVISTALYILALQELTTVPFRVIDEINQGMDATNEARFFNLLCSLAKGPNTPQYFLLTPKMLPPVEYPDNVTFHIIFSGPHVNVPLPGRTVAAGSEDESGEED